MKKKMMKWLMLVAAFGLMVTNVAEAAFRVKTPSTAVRQQALMSLQSAGATDEETVETTTKEKPFSVDFAALGVQNPTNAYLLIMNEQTGNAIALEASDANESKLELPPHALAELEMQHLGASQSYRCMTMCATSSGRDEMIGSQKLASAIGGVELPNFNYRADDGTVKATHTSDRSLVNVAKNYKTYSMLDPSDPQQLNEMRRLQEEEAYYTYTYQMPNGTYYVYDEETKTRIGGQVESVTLGDLQFSVQVIGADRVKNATADQVKKAITYACSIWANAVKGSCPIAMSITFTDEFSSIYTLADSRTPPSNLDNGILYQSTLYNQMQGKDAFPSNYDVTLRFNTNFTDANWCKNNFGVDATYYFGLDKKVGAYQQDFVTVVLHEICHGMGFAGNIAYAPGYWYHGCFIWTQVDGGWVGDAYDYPNVFSRYLSCNGTRLTAMSWSDRAAAVVSNNLYWDGPNVKKLNNGNRVKMYAPTTYQGGSSVSHWDDVVMNSYDVFMTWQHHYPLHEVAPLEKMMMKDLGWTLTDDTPAKPDVPTNVSATKGTIVGQVDVTWSAVSGATSYNVYRSTSASGTYSQVKTGLTSCKYEDKSVSGTTTYYYKVAAVNSAGTSAQSSYAYGYAKATPPVLDYITVTGAATLYGGEYADYTCTAYYSDGSSKNVSTDSGCVWSLPYGSSYGTLSGRRLTAGYLTAQKTATVRATYGGKTDEYTVTILPKTLTVSFVQGSYGTASFTSRAYTVNDTYGTLPTISNVTRGKKFLGWFTASSGGTQITAISTVSGSITKLYAQYGTEVVVESVRTDAPSTVECGSTRTVKVYATYSDGAEKQVTTGVQWSISNSGIPYVITDGVLTLNPSATATGTIRITVTTGGVSSPEYTVTSVNPTKTITLNANGGSVSPTSISQKQGAAFSSLPTPTRTGYNFLGWYTASSGGTRIQNGTVYDGSYTTLYARWEYIVLLDHIAISGSSSVTSGGTATYSCTAYFNNGTSQSGVSASWSANKGSITSGGVFTAPTVTASTPASITASYTWGGLTKTTTHYVTVNPKTVTVAFNANGGSVSPTSKQFTVGLAYGTLPTPTRTNWDFVGWFTAAAGGTQVSSATVATEGLTTLYARWEKLPVSIAISGSASVTSGGTATYTATVTYSDNSTLSPASATWSASSGSITSGGVFTAPTVTANQGVTIGASYTAKGVTVTASKAVTATAKKVTVAFDANGGSVSPASQQFTVGLKYGTLPTPTRTNWDFKGWFTAASGGVLVTGDTVATESLTVLYAHWEKTLSSIAISGAASVVSGSTNEYICTATWSDSTTTEGVTPTWGASAGSIDAVGAFRAPTVTANQSVTITASYTSKGVTKTATKTVTVTPKKVTVTFDPNGGTVSPASQQFTVGLTYGTLPVPTKSGYEFKGWFTALSGGTEVTVSTVATESLTTVYARWEYIVVLSSITIGGSSSVTSGGTATYSCTANFSDGTSQAGVSATWSASAGSITSGGVFTAPTVTASRIVTITASYTWKGVTKTTTKTVTATAKKVTVAFDANGGTVSPASQQFTVGLAYGTLPTPTRTSWDFVGWFTAAVGGARVTSATVATEAVTTLYARWDKTLTSIAISGSASVVSGSTNTYVSTATWSDGTTTANVSATWTASGGAIDDAGRFEAPLVTANSNVTITASYTSKGVTKTATKAVTVTPKKVTVTFNANGGTVSPASQQFTVGLTYGTLPVPTKSGYVFDGWFTALDETGVPVTAATSVIEAATTLYAKWHEEVVLRGLTINGATSVESGGTATYTCIANYSDGTTANVTPAWSFASGGSYATITSAGVLTANQTTASRTVVVKATFSGIATTLTVVIRPKTVTVTFDANGGTASEASREYIVGAKYGAFPSVQRAGYRFLGWFTAATGGTRILENTDVAQGVATLHAQWQENPPALKEIMVSCESELSIVTSGSSLQLICSAVYTNDAVTVTNVLNGADVGWTTDDASVGTVGAGGVFNAARVTTPSIAIVTARYQGMTSPEFAVWVEPEKVTVSFNANGGTVAEASREYVVGAAYGELPVATPRSEDYRFDGWFTAVEGGIRVTEATICEKTVPTLYAHWSLIVRLTGLRVVGENVVTSSVPVAYSCYGVYSDGSEVLATPDWSVAPAALGVIDSEGTFTAAYVTEETTAAVMAVVGSVTGALEVAIQPMEVSVRFDPCNGAVTPQRMSFVVGAAYGELPVPVRSRYDFDGWYTREGKAGDLVTAESTVAEDVETLYAGWTPTPHSLTGIRIEGVETVTSGGNAVFSCKAVYSDGTEGSVVPVWSLVKGLDYASLTLTGFFYAEEVESSQKVTIQAVYTDKGIRYEDQHVVTITPATLVVDPGAMSLEAGAQTKSIFVDSYGTWSVRTDADWITLAKTSGAYIDTVDFSVSANTGTEERTGTIYVTGDGLTATCVVKQYSPIPDEYVMVTLDTKIPGQAASQRQYAKGRKFGYLPTPVRTGYAFGGWWTLPNGAGTRVHAMTVVTDDTLMLYGHWTDVSVGYALNNALDWVEDATHPWAFDYTEAMDRKVSMTTPAIGNRQSSSMSALVEGPGSISFYWRTSSEEFFDTLALYVDGKYVASISGETGWQTLSKAVTGYGQHVITWTYSKDGQGSAGMDCAWLDMVTWIPDYAGSGAASILSADGRAVPETWLNSYGLDTRAASLDEDSDGDGMTNYEEYVAGTDPLDAESRFIIYIEMKVDGTPEVGAVPDLGDTDKRTYILEGKENLSDEQWAPADATIHHFFRARIEVR